jgi:hypothetical protein
MEHIWLVWLLWCDFCCGETSGFLNVRRCSCYALAYRLAIAIKDVSKTREEQDANHAHQSAVKPSCPSTFTAPVLPPSKSLEPSRSPVANS